MVTSSLFMEVMFDHMLQVMPSAFGQKIANLLSVCV